MIMKLLFAFSLFTLLFEPQVWAWGNKGHELIAEKGTQLAKKESLMNCHLTLDQIVEHSTDPDLKWRKDRRRHPDEEYAHFFHVDTQPPNWREKSGPTDITQGFLVYRIVKWTGDAKKLRREEKWVELSEKLFGLVHYIGDLSMPLHLTKNHDGKEVGLPDLHKQWESKMVYRYYEELAAGVDRRLRKDGIPSSWNQLELNSIIFNTAEQSYAKARRLYNLASETMIIPRGGRHGKRRGNPPKPRFIKSSLFDATGALAEEQLAISSRIWAFVLNQICSP